MSEAYPTVKLLINAGSPINAGSQIDVRLLRYQLYTDVTVTVNVIILHKPLEETNRRILVP